VKKLGIRALLILIVAAAVTVAVNRTPTSPFASLPARSNKALAVKTDEVRSMRSATDSTSDRVIVLKMR
jgi:hypothetical protein